VSGSILTHAGLPELITRDLPTYEALAYSLATDAQLLGRTRARVAEAKASSLYDAESFARDLERVYLTMAERGAPGA
jgi:predicted O-linked N-acetylglucosamine transferase (SPINDLY family)